MKNFIKWVEEGDYLRNYSLNMMEKLISFIKKDWFTQGWDASNIEERKKQIFLSFENASSKCNEFNDNQNVPGFVEAYVILHFLDRYMRFLKIYLKLLEMRIFPFKEELVVLDIGPAPSLYALSDIFYLLKNYYKEKIKIKEMNLGYVEQSRGFQNFLHHFTEVLNFKVDKEFWYLVPYHHYIEEKFNDLEFNKVQYDYFNRRYLKKIKLRPDFVICSNFFTEDKIVDSHKVKIEETLLNMRNRGVFLIVGSSAKNYRPIYKKLEKIVKKTRYNNFKFRGSCKKVVTRYKMSYSYKDEYGEILKKYYEEILNIFFTNNSDKNDTEKKLRKIVDKDYDKDITWSISVFLRKSRYRNRNSYYKNIKKKS